MSTEQNRGSRRLREGEAQPCDARWPLPLDSSSGAPQGREAPTEGRGKDQPRELIGMLPAGGKSLRSRKKRYWGLLEILDVKP